MRTLAGPFAVLFVGMAVIACAAATPSPVTPQGSTTPAPEPSSTNVPASPTTASSTPTSAASTPTVSPSAGALSPAGSATIPAGATPALDAARRDLAGRAGIAASQIVVVSAASVDWPDSALGCPQPGFAYSQIVTPGYKFVLEASGKTYEYHTDRVGQRVVYCANPKP